MSTPEVTKFANASALVLLLPIAIGLAFGVIAGIRLHEANAETMRLSSRLNDINASLDRLDDTYHKVERATTEDALSFAPVLGPEGGWGMIGEPGEPKRLVVGIIQPTLQPDMSEPTASQTVHIKNMALLASRWQDSLIGGVPPDVEPSRRPAPIVIEDSIVDKRIRLAGNVTIGRNVRFADVH